MQSNSTTTTQLSETSSNSMTLKKSTSQVDQINSNPSNQTKSNASTKQSRSSSPSPSNASSTSYASVPSEGIKGSNSAAQTKFGADSPKAVKKLMALSEPGKTRQRKPGPLSSNQASKRTSSVSSIHSNNSSSSLQASAKAQSCR